MLKLAGKIEEEVLDTYKVEESKRGAYRRQRLFVGMEACAKKQEVQSMKVGR